MGISIERGFQLRCRGLETGRRIQRHIDDVPGHRHLRLIRQRIISKQRFRHDQLDAVSSRPLLHGRESQCGGTDRSEVRLHGVCRGGQRAGINHQHVAVTDLVNVDDRHDLIADDRLRDDGGDLRSEIQREGQTSIRSIVDEFAAGVGQRIRSGSDDLNTVLIVPQRFGEAINHIPRAARIQIAITRSQQLIGPGQLQHRTVRDPAQVLSHKPKGDRRSDQRAGSHIDARRVEHNIRIQRRNQITGLRERGRIVVERDFNPIANGVDQRKARTGSQVALDKLKRQRIAGQPCGFGEELHIEPGTRTEVRQRGSRIGTG